MNDRSCGILMPIFSLPSPYGIGTFGREAYAFVDFLHASGQKWWQILPLGPTGYGDSPYQSFSSHAGNPYFIDPETLVEDGLLEEKDLLDHQKNKGRIDYGSIYNRRFPLLRKAYGNASPKLKEEAEEFRKENASWLDDYALYMATKEHFGMKGWQEWPDEGAKRHQADALSHYREMLRETVDFHVFLQYLFYKEWNALRTYAHERGIGIIGDIPIYVAMDSADVWASPELFLLDEDYVPQKVAGVPPDYFNSDGQLWGNPLYDWEKMKKDGYSWWKKRIGSASRLYDALRFDHFRGLEKFYAVPYGDTTARRGEWLDGPKKSFVDEMNRAFPNLFFMAEDLGYLTDEVVALLSSSTWPGMKILQFAFDTRETADYDPSTYSWNTICYTGTHDNAPLGAWVEEASREDVEGAVEYLGCRNRNEIPDALIKKGMASASRILIVPLQDYLGLGKEGRINTPGYAEGNWQWRVSPDTDWEKLSEKVRELSKSRLL